MGSVCTWEGRLKLCPLAPPGGPIARSRVSRWEPQRQSPPRGRGPQASSPRPCTWRSRGGAARRGVLGSSTVFVLGAFSSTVVQMSLNKTRESKHDICSG